MKRVGKILLIGLCTGLILAAAQNALKIDKEVFLRWYWIVALGIVVGAAAINVGYSLVYLRRQKRLVELLEEGRVQEYLSGIKALLATARGKNLRNILTLNLAAGHLEGREFDQALPLLEGLSNKRLRGSAVNTVHRINLCLCYFYTSRYEKAMEVYEDSRELFRRYRGQKLYGGSIGVLDVIAHILRQEYDRAEEDLEEACRTYQDPRLQKTFGEIRQILEDWKAGSRP